MIRSPVTNWDPILQVGINIPVPWIGPIVIYKKHPGGKKNRLPHFERLNLTLLETNSEFAPENRPKPNRKAVFQRRTVSFREGNVGRKRSQKQPHDFMTSCFSHKILHLQDRIIHGDSYTKALSSTIYDNPKTWFYDRSMNSIMDFTLNHYWIWIINLFFNRQSKKNTCFFFLGQTFSTSQETTWTTPNRFRDFQTHRIQ